MQRTSFIERKLPNYTRREELINMISHIVGGGLGFVALLTCVIVAAYNQNVMGIVSGGIYGLTLILLFTMSSIYHGLTIEVPKKVFRIIDHCTIYILIAGTYTPVLLGKFRVAYPVEAWTMFGIIWALAILGIVLNGIDLHRFKVLSMICYLGMGWLIVFKTPELIKAVGGPFFIFLAVGGILYTVGALFYIIGKKKKYMHSVFHIFVDAAALLHFLGIAIYIMPA